MLVESVPNPIRSQLYHMHFKCAKNDPKMNAIPVLSYGADTLSKRKGCWSNLFRIQCEINFYPMYFKCAKEDPKLNAISVLSYDADTSSIGKGCWSNPFRIQCDLNYFPCILNVRKTIRKWMQFQYWAMMQTQWENAREVSRIRSESNAISIISYAF